MASKTRDYDIILLGATGYTGKYTAEYITANLSTNIKWAVAGRSQSKLESLVKHLRSLNSTRDSPDIITTNLSAPELSSLVKRTRVILNTVGPYHLYSTPIVAAAAENGTHYLDVTGETPWVKEVIDKYDTVGKKTSAILIPSIGVESAPSDLIAYVATGLVRQIWDCGVMDIIACVHEIKYSGVSGGTFATAMSLLDSYPSSVVRESLTNPFVLSPRVNTSDFKANRHTTYPEPTSYERTSFEKLTGVWKYPLLGTLTTSITAPPNTAIVHRSAGLQPLFYGFNFTYEEYMRVSNPVIGMFIHFVLVTMTLLLSIAPLRLILKAILKSFNPGQGPDKEASKSDLIEYRAVAVAEQLGKPRKALAHFRYEGSMYSLTAVLLAEAAMVLLDDKEVEGIKKRFRNGGVLTPSSLGDAYVERLNGAGIKLGCKQLGDIGSK